MKKTLFTLILLAACGKEQSPAEIMVKAQVPGATCTDYGTKDNVNIARCYVPGENGGVTGLAVYSTAYPFQFFPLKGVEKAPAKQAPAPAPTATPDAGIDAATSK